MVSHHNKMSFIREKLVDNFDKDGLVEMFKQLFISN
jgi:hypothetical protein